MNKIEQIICADPKLRVASLNRFAIEVIFHKSHKEVDREANNMYDEHANGIWMCL